MARQIVIALIQFYRIFLSPLKNILTFGHGVCRFHPTCSQYAVEAIRTHGVFLGLKLAIKRLLRCHPWGGFGEDQVPSRLMNSDEKWMKLAIKLAKKGVGQTAPNPIVGAVVVSENKLLGSGYHEKAGSPHAEPNAISDAISNGFSTDGATIYVTLEPCSTTGRTPPCTDAIIRAGLKRVVIGNLDPNPLHNGIAIEILKKSGIEVEIASQQLQKTCFDLNPEFNSSFQK